MRSHIFIAPIAAATLLATFSPNAKAGVEVPEEGPCCYGTAAWESPQDMPLVDQGGNAYVYNPASTLMAGTCASGSSANGFVFGVTDISDQANATFGTDWGLSTVNVSPTANEAPMYHHADWTRDKMGEVFGIAYGPDGTIYLTATEIYPTAGTNTGGEVWRIDPVSGAPSLLTTLPSNPSKSTGLGNIAYDCARDQLLITNFYDGGIYRVDPSTGAILESITHQELLTGMPANPSDIWSGNDVIVPKLAVPWGIAVWGDYVYYGTWQNGLFAQVYAIQLDGSGAFIPATHELQLTEGDPGWENYGGAYAPADANAVSDIAFKEGRMLFAERAQVSLHNSWQNTLPHQSRMYEWEYSTGVWTRTQDVGLVDRRFHMGGGGSSGSGGASYDYDGLVDPEAPDGRVWSTADCISDSNVPGCSSYGAYGMQADGNGALFTAGTFNDLAVFVDYDRDQTGQDKRFVGDVELTCKADVIDVDCLETVTEIIDCGTGDWMYDWQVTFTNESDFPFNTLIFEPNPADPSVETGENVGDNNTVSLGSPLNPGDSITVDMGINAPNAEPGDELCFDVKVTDEDEDFCCTEVVSVCVILPDCRECNNSIVGIKFHDKNGNGIWDANDVPLSNWDINLVWPNSTLQTVTTDNSGAFIFDSLPAGTGYDLTETQQPGWVQTLPLGGPNGYNVDFTDPNGSTQVLYFGNDKGDIILDPDLMQGEPLIVGGEDKDIALLDFDLPGQEGDMKVRSVVLAIDDQDAKDRLQGLKIVADLDGNGEYDSLDRLLGSQFVDAESGLLTVEFNEALELATDENFNLLVVADFGAEREGRDNGAAVGALVPWGGVGFGLALGFLVLGAASVTRRRRSLVWATAGASAALGLTLSMACQSEVDETTNAYRVSVLKVVATDANTGHYADVTGVDELVSPWIIIKD